MMPKEQEMACSHRGPTRYEVYRVAQKSKPL